MPHISVQGIPTWVDPKRLLGANLQWQFQEGWHTKGPAAAIADVQARLRGLHLNGKPVTVDVAPKLKRTVVREARRLDAIRRRTTTPGFLRTGTQLDEEGRFSLTPEVLALALAKRFQPHTVVDACCGCGGNAIAFARQGAKVTAFEVDPGRAAKARHNAKLYGADITIQVADAVEQVAHHSGDLLFIDPPWGKDWNRPGLTIADLPPTTALLESAGDQFGQMAIKVPPSCVVPDGFGAQAIFGEETGDWHRIKFVLLASI